MFSASQQNLANALSGNLVVARQTNNPTAQAEANSYNGPERRAALASSVRWMAAMLDEVDYGMLLLSGEDQILHVNHAGRAELDASHPLQLVGRQVRARCSQDVAPLACALRAATQRGLRKLLSMGEGDHRASVSVVPLAVPDDGSGPVTLLMLGKRQACEGLSVQGFASSHGLTLAETRVLAGLCNGQPPTEIAAQVGVKIATVRTQIGTIRMKTGAPSIRALIQQVAVLPPMMGALRSTSDLNFVAWSGGANGKSAQPSLARTEAKTSVTA
jgi:DNA-binding CsgD family transcriptional regulator